MQPVLLLLLLVRIQENMLLEYAQICTWISIRICQEDGADDGDDDDDGARWHQFICYQTKQGIVTEFRMFTVQCLKQIKMITVTGPGRGADHHYSATRSQFTALGQTCCNYWLHLFICCDFPHLQWNGKFTTIKSRFDIYCQSFVSDWTKHDFKICAVGTFRRRTQRQSHFCGWG